MPSCHLILWHTLLLLPSIFPSWLFQWVNCLHQMTKRLEFQLQYQSFQWVFRVDFPWDWLIWSSCHSRDSQESSPAPHFEGIDSLVLCLLYGPPLTLIRDRWKDHSLDYMDLCQQGKIFNTEPRFVIAFLPRSNHLLILWLYSPSVVILESKKRKSVTTSTFSTSICHEVMGLDAMIWDFSYWVLGQLFHSSPSPLSRGSLMSHYSSSNHIFI